MVTPSQCMTDTKVSYEIMNFVGICRVENFSDNKEGQVPKQPSDLAPQANNDPDWQCSVDKSEVLKVFEGYHPSLLAVIE